MKASGAFLLQHLVLWVTDEAPRNLAMHSSQFIMTSFKPQNIWWGSAKGNWPPGKHPWLLLWKWIKSNIWLIAMVINRSKITRVYQQARIKNTWIAIGYSGESCTILWSSCTSAFCEGSCTFSFLEKRDAVESSYKPSQEQASMGQGAWGQPLDAPPRRGERVMHTHDYLPPHDLEGRPDQSQLAKLVTSLLICCPWTQTA